MDKCIEKDCQEDPWVDHGVVHLRCEKHAMEFIEEWYKVERTIVPKEKLD